MICVPEKEREGISFHLVSVHFAGNVPLAAFTGFNCTYCNVVLNSLEQLSAHREGMT